MKKHSVANGHGEAKWLSRISLFAFDRARLMAFLWLILTVIGILSYTTFLKREGFPSVNFPFSVVSGVYLAGDPAKVDTEITKPISDIVLQDNRVASVLASAHGTFYSVFIQYDEGTDANQAGKELEQRVKEQNSIPAQATMEFTTPKFGFTERGDDAVISLYATNSAKNTTELAEEGKRLAEFIKQQNLATLESVSLINPYIDGVNPATGMLDTNQIGFDRFGVRNGDAAHFFDSVAVGAVQKKGTDGITFDDELRAAVGAYNQQTQEPFKATVTASYAPQIKDQISELQRALLEGLIAVLVVGAIVIAVRASLITVLSMLTVLALTIGLLFTIGYTLNTITLFSLILCLALIVDDTIIMIEAIDAQRRRRKDPRETVKVASRKISRAMVAATLTAVLSFVPLLFVGGILGSFIRAIPVTVISSLLISLLVALIFIPIFARMLLLGKKQMGAENVHEPAAGIEAKIARFISGPMLWARHSTKKMFAVGMVAVIIGFSFIGAAGFLFQKVTFNIFPPTKDTNDLLVQLEFPAGSTIEQATELARQSDEIVYKTLGENFRQASYYASGSTRDANLYVGLIPYSERDDRSPQLVDRLKTAFKDFSGAKVTVSQLDVGPPFSPFTVRIDATNRAAAERLAADMQTFLLGKELTRLSGEKAKIVSVSVSDPATYERADGRPFVQVSASFDGTDISTLVTLAQTAVEKEFTAEKVRSYGLADDAIQFNFGQEEENQDSFKSLVVAFPLVLAAIFILLAIQFRSLVQPLLIFMAIPFSLFGITLGLYITDNPFSFFAMLGFFALIGLSLKNTILLTDYANQQRRAGVPAVDAAVEALGERFRPLIATSLTAVVSLIPLALMSPFWEGLAVVLICGLLSSTLLVILVFPYYYLGVEFMRAHISRRSCLIWLALTILAAWGLAQAGLAAFTPIVSILIALALLIWSKRSRRK